GSSMASIARHEAAFCAAVWRNPTRVFCAASGVLRATSSNAPTDSTSPWKTMTRPPISISILSDAPPEVSCLAAHALGRRGASCGGGCHAQTVRGVLPRCLLCTGGRESGSQRPWLAPPELPEGVRATRDRPVRRVEAGCHHGMHRRHSAPARRL